jgi:hypothetical protein
LEGAKGSTHGAVWRGGIACGSSPRSSEARDAHVAKEAISAAVVCRITRTRVFTIAEVLPVGLVGDEVGAPAVVVLDDGEGVFQGGAVAEAAAVALEVTFDWTGSRLSATRFRITKYTTG